MKIHYILVFLKRVRNYSVCLSLQLVFLLKEKKDTSRRHPLSRKEDQKEEPKSIGSDQRNGIF